MCSTPEMCAQHSPPWHLTRQASATQQLLLRRKLLVATDANRALSVCNLTTIITYRFTTCIGTCTCRTISHTIRYCSARDILPHQGTFMYQGTSCSHTLPQGSHGYPEPQLINLTLSHTTTTNKNKNKSKPSERKVKRHDTRVCISPRYHRQMIFLTCNASKKA